MKKIIILLTSFVMIFSSNFVLADEITNTSANEVLVNDTTKIKELSINEAVVLAKESNREMWKIDDALEQIKENRRQADDAKETAETIMSMSLEQLSLMKIDITSDYVSKLMAKNGYYIKYADTQTKEIEKNKELLNVSIGIETKSLYYNVLISEKSIEINKANLNKANEQLRVINLKYNSGSATKAEVLNGQIAVQQAQTGLDSSYDDFQMAKLNLLNIINLPLDTGLNLTSKDLSYVPAGGIDLSESIEKAKLERPEILKAENVLELQKIETHVYTAYYTSNLRQHKSAEEKLKDAEFNLPQAYKDVELDVRKSYLSLIESERALVNMNKTVELAKEYERINKLLYANGMTTSLDVLESDAQLTQSEIGQYQLLASYNINKMMFDYSYLVAYQAKQ